MGKKRKGRGNPAQAWEPCVYCNGNSNTWDHIVPKSQGGRNSPDNLARACGRCNRQKGDLPLVIFLAYRALGVEEAMSLERMHAHAERARLMNVQAAEARARRLMRGWLRKAAHMKAADKRGE